MSDRTCFSCALITGASSGLGEEFALQLAPHADCLILVARREGLMEKLAERIRTLHPATAVAVMAADLTLASERERLVTALSVNDLAPDLLINNAGLGDYGEFATAEWPKLESMLRLNVEALTHLTHALVPGMIRQGGGGVVNVSSLACLLPIPDFAVYAATKAYVTSFSEALRLELREHGIPVLALCPGPVHTGFGEVAGRGAGGPKMPGYEWFYVPKEQVVAGALAALARNQARVYPGLKTAAAALVLAAIPIILLRVALGLRPRRH